MKANFGLAVVGVLGAGLAMISGSAQATLITCPSSVDAERTVTIDYTGSGITCGPSGSTPPAEGQVLTNSPYNLTQLEKDDGVGDNNNGGLLDISGIGGVSGAFTVDPLVTDALLVFKVGSGGLAPDWISFYLNGITSGDWSVDPARQALSHATLYGATTTRQVPEPASLALVGLGVLGLGLTRRRRRTIR